MYLIIEIEFKSSKDYITKAIRSIVEIFGIDIEVKRQKDKIVLITKEDTKGLKEFLKRLENLLPASIYLGKSTHKIVESYPDIKEFKENSLATNLSLCPSCQKEIFDISSKRYYYPFTSCNVCGSKHSFLETHPLKREDSFMKFLTPCESCKKEMRENPFRSGYELISCIECGIALKMRDKKSERFANDKGSFKRLFEVVAKAIKSGKSVVVKSTFGYRKFTLAKEDNIQSNSILLFTNASKLNTHLMMIPQEFEALLSIERPIIRVATKSSELKELFGSSVWCKYADDGVSMLLAKEMLDLGEDYIIYHECDEDEDGDFLVDFDLPIKTQKDFKLFINQDTKLLIDGERSIFPATFTPKKSGRVVIANSFVSLDGVIDKRDRFKKIPASEVLIEKDEPLEYEGAVRFDGFKASMLSVLSEHKKLNEKAVGVVFDDRLHFLYYNQKELIDVVSAKPFDVDNLFRELSSLREGSDRLVANFKKSFPKLYDRLEKLSGEYELFEVVAILLELEDESFDGISAKALEFMGKGGVQIDTRVEDNRFDEYAFLASIISYKLTKADEGLLCYSIYESLGDFIADIVVKLFDKTKAKTPTLSGKNFANPALFARIERNLKHYNPILNKEYPIGKESEVYGGNFL